MPLCRCLPAGTGPGSKGVWAPNGRFVTMTRLFARWPLPVAVVLAPLAPRRSRRTLRRPRLEWTHLQDQDRDRDHHDHQDLWYHCTGGGSAGRADLCPRGLCPGTCGPGRRVLLHAAAGAGRARRPDGSCARRRPQPTFSCPPALPRWPRHRSSPSPRRPSLRHPNQWLTLRHPNQWPSLRWLTLQWCPNR